ncbi:unnamed protein product, partial [Polarella glacialis]
NWLEGASVASETSATTIDSARTRFSDLTLTSVASSICSDPGTMHQAQFRGHRRAIAANKNSWRAVDQYHDGALADGVPKMFPPLAEWMQTATQLAYGPGASDKENISNKFESVFQDEHHPLVDDVLENAPPAERKQMNAMVRSLDYLRREHKMRSTSTTNLAMDLHEKSLVVCKDQSCPEGNAPASPKNSPRMVSEPHSPGVSAEALIRRSYWPSNAGAFAPTSLPNLRPSSAGGSSMASSSRPLLRPTSAGSSASASSLRRPVRPQSALERNPSPSSTK